MCFFWFFKWFYLGNESSSWLSVPGQLEFSSFYPSPVYSYYFGELSSLQWVWITLKRTWIIVRKMMWPKRRKTSQTIFSCLIRAPFKTNLPQHTDSISDTNMSTILNVLFPWRSEGRPETRQTRLTTYYHRSSLFLAWNRLNLCMPCISELISAP